jgi:hypothetical protein
VSTLTEPLSFEVPTSFRAEVNAPDILYAKLLWNGLAAGTGNGIERLSNHTNTFAPSTRSSPGHPSEESLGRWISHSAADMQNALTFQNTKITRQDVRFFEKVQYATILFKRSKTDYDHRGVTIVVTALMTPSAPSPCCSLSWKEVPSQSLPRFFGSQTAPSHEKEPHNNSLTQQEIQTLGRWSSDAVHRYYKTNLKRVIQLHKQFQTGLG